MLAGQRYGTVTARTGGDEAPGFATQVAAAIDAAGSRWVFDDAPYNAELLVYPRAEIAELFARPEPAQAQRLRFTRRARWLRGCSA